MRVKVYTTEDCSNCKHLKKILDKAKIPYEEVEITIDVKADLVTEFSIHSAPALEIEGLVFSFAGEWDSGNFRGVEIRGH
jgi:glutaredoxin